MSRAVADATVLIYLARLGDLHMLDELFESIVVPDSVYEEVVHRGHEEGYSDAIAVEDAVESFLDIRSLEGDTDDCATRLRETTNLGTGEVAALALAANGDARCLTDDHAARRTAESLDINVGGTIYVFLRALRRDNISFQGFETRLDALDEAGFRMSAELYRRAIEAGEELAE